MRTIVQMASAQTTLIDGLKGETFYIRMVTSIEFLQTINLSPGQLYVFVLTQDHIGGHAIAWEPLALNATQPDAEPYSITTVTFVAHPVDQIVGPTPKTILQATLAGGYSGQSTQSVKDGKKRWRPRFLAQSQPSK